jgi:hypothetical protein
VSGAAQAGITLFLEPMIAGNSATTIQPALPAGSVYESGSGGTEYFLSSLDPFFSTTIGSPSMGFDQYLRAPARVRAACMRIDSGAEFGGPGCLTLRATAWGAAANGSVPAGDLPAMAILRPSTPTMIVCSKWCSLTGGFTRP